MKTCTKCQAVYDLSKPLPSFVGWQKTLTEAKLALFNCNCGSTLAVPEEDLKEL